MTGSDLWFYWPLGGWGAGIASDYYFGVRRANKNLDEYERAAEKRISQAWVQNPIAANMVWMYGH